MRACASWSFLADASSASSSAASWRRSAAICWLSTSTCASARAVSRFSESSWPASSVTLPCASAGAAADALVEAPEAVAFAFGARQAGAHLRDLLLEAHLAGLFQRQQLGELRDLRVEAGERGVLSGHLLRQVELHDREHGQQEDDAEDQRRQRVDEARPVVHAGVAAGTCDSHGGTYLWTFSRTSISSRRRISRCCSDWESTQSRIICCSVRMWWTSP